MKEQSQLSTDTIKDLGRIHFNEMPHNTVLDNNRNIPRRIETYFTHLTDTTSATHASAEEFIVPRDFNHEDTPQEVISKAITTPL
ncbi:hypothetical protein M8J75_007560 [Diaphorina citri]|nr:hypothetical protein M8J75_007560 [Diaphorina citri]KAI5743155.1 hypothetical protein M8J77_015146 [Diaphorina citri]